MMVQNEHWNGQPRPRSKLDLRPSLRARAAGGRLRRRRAFDARQVVHVVVERLQRAVPGVEQDRRRAGLPRPRRRRSRCPCPWPPGSRAARPAASTGSPAAWKPPIATGRPALRKWRARSTARGNWLDCTPTRQISALPPLRLMSAMMRSGRTRVLVSSNGLMTMSTSGPKHAALAAVLTQAIERSQGVGRDMGAQPRDRIAVVVVMRRLDQDEVESRTLLLHRPSRTSPSSKTRVRLGLRYLPPLTASPRPQCSERPCNATEVDGYSQFPAGNRTTICRALAAQSPSIGEAAMTTRLIAVRVQNAHGPRAPRRIKRRSTGEGTNKT